MQRRTNDSPPPRDAAPWWRYGIVWLVISGPAIVVMASVATGVLAYRGADLLVVDAPASQQQATTPTGQTPAMQARNHAATAAPR